MFVCNHCKQMFETPKTIQESRGEFWGFPCTEKIPVCPFCERDDFEKEVGKEENDC